MRKFLRPLLAVVSLTAASLVSVAATAQAAPADPSHHHPRATIITETHHDVSPPLRGVTPNPTGGDQEEAEVPGPLPHPSRPVADPVVQHTAGVLAPTVGANFDGLGQGFTGPGGTFSITGAPPDPNSAVGATQVVEIVNTGFAVFSKTGTVLFGPANTNTLFSGFGGSCQTTNDGDGIVRYDTLANRWVITQFANVNSTTGPFFECVAVSQTSDATGAYNRYSFQYPNFPDYPKLSVWPDAYYITYNTFNATGTVFLGAESCALNRAAMIAGTTATQQCFTTSNSFGGLLPADVDGTAAPPAGAPNLQLALGTSNTQLVFWKFHVDFTTPANTTFTGPTTLTVAAYTTPCGTTGTCIPQQGGAQLDSLGDRLMFRLAYRNFGDHQSLVTSHSVTSGSSVAERWYEFRLDGSGNPTVFQQSTYAPDATFRWMGSVAMDKVGNMALGFSDSSSTTHPSVRFTGRLAGDPAGQMTQGESTAVTGAGSQTGTLTRWGDYTSMSVDPADGCTFWYTNEYIPANGTFNWKTRNVSFTLPNCTGTPPPNDFSISVNPNSGTVTAGGSTTATVSTAVTSGSAQTVTLSASGLPAGAAASFNPASVTAGGSSTMTITTSTTTPAGTSPITITGTGTSATHTTFYNLTVNGGGGGCTSPGQKLGNPGFESGNTVWTATPAVIGQNGPAEPAHSGTFDAWMDGYGTNHTDSISQSVTIPAGCTNSTLTFFLHIDSAETTTTTQFDKLTITLGSTTLGTFSNLNKAAGYTQRSFPVGSFAGQTLTLTFTGVEDSSLQTSFVVDDTALNAS
jgi:hypothetical protein